jgi:TM2 domain-containing membrane protein YozV
MGGWNPQRENQRVAREILENPGLHDLEAATTPAGWARAGLAGAPLASPKSYGVAVVLSSVLGFVGAQHFYLGRPWTALLDVSLAVGWIVAFVLGQNVLGAVLLVADFGHGLVVTIQLLTGSFHDGRGRIVCYPGQRLRSATDGP